MLFDTTTNLISITNLHLHELVSEVTITIFGRYICKVINDLYM